MFAEYGKKDAWQTVLPGVSVCRLACDVPAGDLPLTMEKAHSEVFFCTGGSLTITGTDGVQNQIEPRGILLGSNMSHMESAVAESPLEGIAIHVDQLAAGETFRELCRNFGISLSMKLVGEHLHAAGGFRAVPVTPWTRAVFYALRRLPQEDQSRYCVLKTFELLYLICTQEREESGAQRGGSGSMVNVANNMKTYMEAHLDEKLTITELSHRFHLSRTACKSAFRSCFDQPIHAWLLDRRMERAAELLEKTKMPILQVAQSVGYTGVSQFNVAFRQRYGKSPREYRKMSVSVAF